MGETPCLRFLDESWGSTRAKRPQDQDNPKVLNPSPGSHLGIDKKRIPLLTIVSFIRGKITVFFHGTHGVKETQLAVLMGVKAAQLGFSSAYCPLDEFLHVMKRKLDLSQSRINGEKYLKNS